MFVSFFSFVAFTSISPGRTCSAMIIPSLHRVARLYEHRTALLKIEEGKRNDDALPVRHHQPPRFRPGRRAGPQIVLEKAVVDDPRPRVSVKNSDRYPSKPRAGS